MSCCSSYQREVDELKGEVLHLEKQKEFWYKEASEHAEKTDDLKMQLKQAQLEVERLRKELNHVGFYCAGTDFDHVSKYVLKVLEG